MKRLVLFVAGAVLACGALAQQQYPSRPIRMIVPWPPGQATDLAGRVVALKLSDLLGQVPLRKAQPLARRHELPDRGLVGGRSDPGSRLSTSHSPW